MLLENVEFKDSHIGKIPNNWKIIKLGKCASIKYGVNDAIDQTLESGIPTITLPCVKQTGDLVLDKELLGLTSEYKVFSDDYLQHGDLLFNWRNGSQEHLGKTAYFDKVGEYTHVGFLLRIRTNAEVCYSRYLWWQICFIKNIGFFLKAKSQVNNTFNSAELASINVILPPLPEQQKIAEILDTVDKAIALTQTHINKLKQAKAGLLHDLLTKGIDEHGELRNPKRNPEQFKDSPLGKIPKDWEVVRLENLIEKITSGSRGWASYYSDYGAIFIRIGNLNRESLNLKLDDIVYVSPPSGSEGERTKVQLGDILISITADIGIVGVIPNNFGEAYVNQHIALIRINYPEINYNWIGLFLSQEMGQEQFRKFNDSGAKSGLNLPRIASIRIALPNYKEQCEIVSIINHHDNQIIVKQTRLEKIKLLKLGLMSDLLTGKVRVKI
ncbi:MAG: restriction endonuclease subunit S [Nostocaceae cyanobacterium]|nr:restriction endonuclease subunit S [Nostocaceae cyanobacterium]